MKNVIFSVSVVALMLVSSVVTAQEISGCSSCGQQSFVQPVTYNQPIVAATPTFVQPATTTFAQPVTSGCSSCGTASVSNYAAPITTSFAAPIDTGYVAQSTGCTSCAAATIPAPTSACCCSTTSARGGLLRGGRNGGLGGPVSSRLIRGGVIGAIRN